MKNKYSNNIDDNKKEIVFVCSKKFKFDIMLKTQYDKRDENCFFLLLNTNTSVIPK